MYKNAKYDHSNDSLIGDVITDDFVKKLDLKSYQLGLKFNRGMIAKRRTAQKVFFTFLKLVIDDCIENNNRFTSPLKQGFNIFIKDKTKEMKETILKNGKKYTDVDLIQSDFRIYEFVFYSSYLTGVKYRSIRIGYHKYKELVKRVNKGRRYFER